MVMQTKDALKIKQSRFERDTLIMANFGRKMTGITYVNSYMRINEYVREAGKFFKKFDIYLTPTVASSPPLVGSTSNSPFQYYVLQAIDRLGLTRAFLDSPLIQRIITKSISRTPFTQLANLTGAPAMSVPLHWGGDGQPWGVHFTASHAREDILIRLAAQLERAVPWFDKTPD
jgi:amidase